MSETILPRAYPVSEINGYLREYLAEDMLLGDLLIQGELTTYKQHNSGHIYFTLTEGGCSINGALFRNQAMHLNFQPQAGMAVVVWGSIGYYERDGRVQLYARAFFPQGMGESGAALDQLKQKLAAEGLFAEERKKPLPAVPHSLGVITAAGSAAWADIYKVGQARWPGLPIELYPAAVQGERAAESICAALLKADRAGHSVLILGRGGGATEDLAVFNTEAVARAVAETATPIISAVGHEIDTTLADLAADLRAATPSHAASLAIPEVSELQNQLSMLWQRLQEASRRRVAELEHNLSLLRSRPVLQSPHGLLQPQLNALTEVSRRMQNALTGQYDEKQRALLQLAVHLEDLSPLATLRRGYAVCQDVAGQPLRAACEAKPGDQLAVQLAVGHLHCRVEQVAEHNIWEMGENA